MKRVRWMCPDADSTGHAGVMGPSKPRRDNLCRYCVPCSVKEGKLIERVAPAVAKQSERKAQVRTARQQRKRITLRRNRDARWVIDGIDMQRQLIKLRAMIGKHYGLPQTMQRVRFEWRRRMSASYSTGVCYGTQRIVVTAGTDGIDALETILHELMHVVSHAKGWGDDKCASHSLRFRNELSEMACKAFGVTMSDIGRHDKGSSSHRYKIDHAIRDAMREKRSAKLPAAACTNG